MPADSTPQDGQVAMTATYSSQSGQQQFSHPLPPVPDQKSNNYVEVKTAYLNTLRATTKKLQDDINTFLTQKMEEDKATATVGGSTKAGDKMSSTKARDDDEEENYGEEDDEEG